MTHTLEQLDSIARLTTKLHYYKARVESAHNAYTSAKRQVERANDMLTEAAEDYSEALTIMSQVERELAHLTTAA